ncbi:hypothetical protein [Haliangium ochraceum]|uniref:Lipoprotein n=1 Tax=Haliangium ochraceum (strain DSM 14365 / JCM 11303 / SMP-2) TaxID=502025 RepID=D0LYJ0_HALO1|nr:hypothetical protein [Haliangium ochraceum]ACY17856.1 hypothetical protein Hoch_5372 [Haliangium ochraceum DSM 14365]
MKNTSKSMLASAIFALAAMWGLSACGEADELYNCVDICDSVNDCAEEIGVDDFDRSECASECEDESDADEDYRQAAAECEECLDGRDECTDTFPCLDECATVVPSATFVYADFWGEDASYDDFNETY